LFKTAIVMITMIIKMMIMITKHNNYNYAFQLMMS